MTYRDCRGEGSVYGSRHGENSRSLHFRKDVDPIKLDHTHHRHTQTIAELDRFPTPSSSDSPNNRRIMRIENTDHQTSHPIHLKHKNNDYLDRQGSFCTSMFLRDEETFCSWGRCWRSKSVCRLERYPT